MAVPFVLVDASLEHAPVGTEVRLAADARRHLTAVLRKSDDAAIEVADGHGWSAPARLTSDGAQLVEAAAASPAPRPRLHVLQAVAKRSDDALRRLTEIGVDRVSLVESERTVVRLTGDRLAKVRGRWEAVIRAAAEQSRRAQLPVLDGPAPLAELLMDLATPGVIADVGAPRGLAPALRSLGETRPETVVLAVGPEGGWAAAEIAAAVDAGLERVHMGRAVVRSEHAGMALAAAAAALLGRME